MGNQFSSEQQQQAFSILTKTNQGSGVCASLDRYMYQAWTRDFFISVLPCVMNEPNNSHFTDIFNIITILSSKIENGEVPVIYPTDVQSFKDHKMARVQQNGGKKSFMLDSFVKHGLKGLYQLTPWTRDCGCWYIIGVMTFVDHYSSLIDILDKKRLVSSCFQVYNFINDHLLDENGFIKGSDWRDTREDLDTVAILSNACLFYQVHKLLFQPVKAHQLSLSIQKLLWNGSFFRDYQGTEHFDLFGNALAVIFGIATISQIDLIFEHAIKFCDSPYGFKMTEVFLPPLSDQESLIMKRDQSVVWPFVSSYMILAMLLKGDEKKWKAKAFEKICNHDNHIDFYEWYDIQNGKGYGSKYQTWSAATYLLIKYAQTNIVNFMFYQ